MKTRLLIIIGIVITVIFVGFSIFNPVGDFSTMFGDKYQYKFGETTIHNEKNQQFDRAFFSYSHDYGNTFSESKDISMSEDTWTGETKMILMDDYVILVWRESISPVHTLAFATSDDHGKNLEKKYLWSGARPDIVHYDGMLYLTWVDLETRQVSYTTSDDRGDSFGEHNVIFAPTNEFSPYALKPEPKFVIDEETVKITWRSAVSYKGDPQNFEFTIGEDPSKTCPVGQDYNEALFKCVISCDDDLVYNGYTDSCTTHFERKYQGFCNEGFTYQPLAHTCLAENNSDDGIGDLEHTPLKDPPRTAPPEPDPVPMKCKSGPAPSDEYYFDEETCQWITWYEGEEFEKIIQYCTDPKSNTTGEISSISKGGEIKLDSKKCTWMHGGFYNQVWVEQTADPVPLIQNGNVMSPEGKVLRPVN